MDPASWCGVTRCVHSSQQREERTKKRRRCYRASSLGGCHRPRGLRNSLCSNSPRPSSSVDWPPPGPIKAGFAPPFPFAASLDPATSSYRAATRYPGISSAALVLCLPSLDPASWCGVTRCVHSSQQREERTKKRRRCYRASSLGGCHRPRGLRNSLCSNSPRPSSSVDWPPPGPIKAGFAPPFPFAASLDPATSSYRAATRYPGISSAALVLCLPSLDPASWCGVTHTLDLASGVG